MPSLPELVAQRGQQHLLRFWDELSSAQQAELEADVRGVDFAQIDRLYREGVAALDWAAMARRAESPTAFRLDGKGNRISAEEAGRRGGEALSQTAVVLVAGGQGTRLGFPHPKGIFEIGPVSGSSLFQILFEKVLAVGRQYGTRIPLYIMTSPATHEETVAYLAEHERFGLPEEDVTLFCQGTMPAVDASTGQLLLAEKHRLFLSPDGTGGILAAMRRDGVLDDFRHRGIRLIFYMQVDNPLVPVCDPAFLGYHLLSGSELSTLVVAKQSPTENLGNVVSVDGQVQILEYSDLNRVASEEPDILDRCSEDGQSVFWAGNLGIHVIDAAFLHRVAGQEDSLPFHVAKKKVPYLDATSGQHVTPDKENAIKFERFIFDLLPLAREAIVVEGDKFSHFAPLKNGPGAKADTPESVRRQMIDLHRRWLTSAGAALDERAKVEISPLFALDAKGLSKHLKPGERLSGEYYFDARE